MRIGFVPQPFQSQSDAIRVGGAGSFAGVQLLRGAMRPGDASRRRDCHFTDIPSPSLLKHLLKIEGGAAE